jgi:hypothetical protein
VNAALALERARAAGLRLRVTGGDLRVRGQPSPELLAELREHKPGLVAILRGDRCRRCGDRLAWPGPTGVVYADGTAEHHACRTWAAAERALHSPDALADPAEVMPRGERP